MNSQRSIIATLHRYLRHNVEKSSRGFSDFSHRIKPEINHIFDRARDNANNFDSHYNYNHDPLKVNPSLKSLRQPMRPILIPGQSKSHVPNSIPRPPYARNGGIPTAPNHVVIQDEAGIAALRKSARLARKVGNR